MTVLIIVLVLLVLAFICGGLAFHMSIKRGGQNILPKNFKKQNKLPFRLDTTWLDGVAAEDIYITSTDGLRLHAYLADLGSQKWAVICHGYTANAKCMSTFGEQYAAMGYNVLLVDARAHGKSEGKYIGMGWHECKDLLLWLEYLEQYYPGCQIILHGISMGGATVMMCSGQKQLPTSVKAIIEDCGYSSIWQEFSNLFRSNYHLPTFPILYIASFWNRIFNGYWLRRDDSISHLVSQSQTPMLFIHGEGDRLVPAWMLDEVYNAAKCEKVRLLIPDADHGKASVVAPELYWNTIKAFLAKYVSK